MIVDGVHRRTVDWVDGALHLVDQNRLPWRFEVRVLRRWQGVAEAIAVMTVRGAGAIGATGAAGVALAALQASDSAFATEVATAAEGLRATRPTAKNLSFGVDTVLAAMRGLSPAAARIAAVEAARAVIDDDADCCAAIGRHGRVLFRDGMRIATHCNAGWLAFVDWGSALSPIYAAARDGDRLFVWVDETRPRGQGARLTAWELQNEGVPHAVIADGALASRMKAGEVDRVIVGADRIAANGDVANKIGTYGVATLAKAHGIPFYVAAPTTTIDAACPSGDGIVIEERSEDEVAWVEGPDAEGVLRRVRVIAPGASARNPAFDVTPAALVAGIVTERGIVAATIDGIASVTRR